MGTPSPLPTASMSRPQLAANLAARVGSALHIHVEVSGLVRIVLSGRERRIGRHRPGVIPNLGEADDHWALLPGRPLANLDRGGIDSGGRHGADHLRAI